MQTKTLVTVPNGKVWASHEQAESLKVLTETRKGGFARVYGYKPASDWETSPVQDICLITRFSTEKLYERKTKAVNALTFNDVADAISKNPTLAALSVTDAKVIFDERKQIVVESMAKTLEGNRSDAHRQGHDRCYLNLAEGIKVNYVTEKSKADGLMYPVLTDGFPTVASIMITYLENSKVTRVAGVRKVVNSGVPKLMSNAIESVLNKKSVGIKTLSLKEDNFERLVIDGEVVLSEDVAGLV